MSAVEQDDSLAIRAKPRPVKRFNKRVLIGASSVAAASDVSGRGWSSVSKTLMGAGAGGGGARAACAAGWAPTR